MEWMTIDTAPMDGTNVLLWQPVSDRIARLGLRHKSSDVDGEPYTGLWNGYEWKYTCSGSAYTRDDYFGDNVHPTHWMPLPAPPQQGA